jgi:hypothetical protein
MRRATEGVSALHTSFGAKSRDDVLHTPFANRGVGLNAQLAALSNADVMLSVSNTGGGRTAADSGFRVAARAGTSGDGPVRARGAVHVSSQGTDCALATLDDTRGRGGAWLLLPLDSSNFSSKDGADLGFGADPLRIRERSSAGLAGGSPMGGAEVGVRMNGGAPQLLGVRDIEWSLGAHAGAGRIPSLATPPPLKLWAVARAGVGAGLSAGAALALPSGKVDAAVSVAAAEPASELTAEINGGTRAVTVGLTRAFELRRRVYNPFEDAHVKGLWMHGQFALETQRKLDPPGDASLAAGVTLQLNRVVQVAARVTSNNAGPMLALAAAFVSWTQPALRLTLTSHLTPSAQAAFGARLDVTMDSPNAPDTKAHADYGGARVPNPHAPSLRLPVTESARIAGPRESKRAVSKIDAEIAAAAAASAAGTAAEKENKIIL